MLPTVVQNEEDANAWTDTKLREAITWIREHAAGRLFDVQKQRPTKDAIQQEQWLKAKLSAYFPADTQMVSTIWEAIQDTIQNSARKGSLRGSMSS